MSNPARLTAFALVLGTSAMLVSAYAVLSRPPASEPGKCACNTEALESEIASLARRVDVAERNVARGTLQRAAGAVLEPDRRPAREAFPADTDAVADGTPLDADPDAEEPRATPRYESFEISERGVTVTQSEDGALSVFNSDPALTGQIVTVKAMGEDGQVHDLPITVPPPSP